MTGQLDVRARVTAGQFVTPAIGRSPAEVEDVIVVRLENHGTQPTYLSGGVSFERDDREGHFFVGRDAICERVFDDVVLADPQNPDVRCSARGEDWGIECKVLYSEKPNAQQDQLLHKAAQVEGAGISRGVIAVNITGLLDHSANVDSFRYFPAPHGMDRGELQADLDRRAEGVVAKINTPNFKRRLFKNERASGRVADASRSRVTRQDSGSCFYGCPHGL